jgi:hypothetical protein
MVAWSMS